MYNNSLLTRSVRYALMTGAAAAALTAPAVYAAESDNVERIEVTGSAIKRTDMEGALPVTVITDAEISKLGIDTVTELMQQLPSMQGFQTTSQSVGGGGGGVTTASIHDLGASYTLVLLNGRRMAPSGSGSTIDVSTIPLSAIKRVDILTDGASALYGSDAIAGVVNFILKDNVQDTTVAARYTQPQEDGGSSWNANITTGFGDIDTDGYNVLFAYSHDSKEQIKATEREFAKTGMLSFEDNGRQLFFFNGSPNAIPGNGGIVFNDGSEVEFNPYKTETGSCAEYNSPLGDWCWFDYTSTLEIQPESTRDGVFTKAEFDINDSLNAYIEASYSKYEMTARIAPYPTGGLLITTDSPHWDKYFAQHMPAGKTKDDVSLGYGVWRALPAGNRTSEYSTDSIHIVAGLEGVINDNIDWEAGYTYSVNDSDIDYPTGWLIGDKVGDAVNSGAVDIFAAPGVVTAEDVAATGMVYSGPWSNSKTEMNALDFKMSMPLFELNGNDVYMAAGADYRMYDYDNTLSKANEDGILLFMSGGSPDSTSRDVAGVFAEFMVPVLDNLEITGAVRYDYIGAVDDNLANIKVNDSDSDVTYKFSSKWQATDDLLLRASYGTGFKAAAMVDISSPRVEGGVTGSSYNCPFIGTGLALEQYCQSGKRQFNVYSQGNPNLKSEHSKQFAVGFVYAPSEAFSIGLDYWSVEMEDGISSLTQTQIVEDAVKYQDLWTTKTNKQTGQEELAMIQAPVNVGFTNNAGIDWHMNSTTDMGWGTFRFAWTGTYMLDSEYTLPGEDDVWITSLGRWGDDNSVTFRVQSQIRLGLEHDAFNHNVTLNYKSGYVDKFMEAGAGVTLNDALGEDAQVQLVIPSYTLVNYQSTYQFDENTAFTIGINNLFDKQPSLTLGDAGSHQVGYDPRYTDAYGRTFYLSGSYTF